MEAHGVLLVDKPTGVTSHDLVQTIRRLIRQKSVGHAGTLDPLASGLMVLLLGEGTKLSDYLLTGDKTYQLKVRFGIETDTLDREGRVLRQEPVHFKKDQILDKAQSLLGEFHWQVPAYSAVKVNGEKLYEKARKDIPQDLPEKLMKFWGLKVFDIGDDYLTAQITCAKGGFIRTWASELGKALGSFGMLDELRRIESKPFKIENAMPVSAVSDAMMVQGAQIQQMGSAFVALENALPHWRAVTVKGKEEKLINNGQISYDLERRLLPELKEATKTQNVVGIRLFSGESGQLLSIIEAQPNKGLKIKRVFKVLAAEPKYQ